MSSDLWEAFVKTFTHLVSSFLLCQGEREFQHILCNSESLKSCPQATIYWGKGHFMWFWQGTGSGNLHDTYCYPVDVLVFHLEIFCWVKSWLGKFPGHPFYIIFQSRRKCYVPPSWHNCRTYHFLINSLSTRADQNISIPNPSRRVLSKWVSLSQENSPPGYSEVTWWYLGDRLHFLLCEDIFSVLQDSIYSIGGSRTSWRNSERRSMETDAGTKGEEMHACCN